MSGDKSRARASHDQHADTRNEQHLTRAAENRVRREERELAKARARAACPGMSGYDDTGFSDGRL
jgi:hypothetical protein